MDTAVNKLLKATKEFDDEGIYIPSDEDLQRMRDVVQNLYGGDEEPPKKPPIEGLPSGPDDDGKSNGNGHGEPTTGELMDMKTDSERWKEMEPPKESPPNIQNDSALNKLLKAVDDDDEEDGEFHRPDFFYIPDSFLAEMYKEDKTLNPKGRDWNSLSEEAKDSFRASYKEQIKADNLRMVNEGIEEHMASKEEADEAMRSKQDEAMQPEKTEEYTADDPYGRGGKISSEDWKALTDEEQLEHLSGRFAEMTGGFTDLEYLTHATDVMDMKTDSERWKEMEPPEEFPPNIQNESALDKLLKAVKLEDGRRLQGIGTQYGTSPTDPFSRIHEIEPDDYGPDSRYHQVDTSSQWGTPDLHSYGYGHEKPDISGESVKPYWEQMNELPTIEEEQEAKQAKSPTQKLMNQVLG